MIVLVGVGILVLPALRGHTVSDARIESTTARPSLALASTNMSQRDVVERARNASTTTVASDLARAAPRRVQCLTFADRANVYLHALAASVMHFNEGRPLHVLGLAGHPLPVTTTVWNMSRRASIETSRLAPKARLSGKAAT